MSSRTQIYGLTSGGTQNALAQIDIPKSGSIVRVCWSLQPDLDTDNDSLLAQISFGSVISQANDSRQVISNVTVGVYTLTGVTGVISPQVNYQDMIEGIPVSMGERIFLHTIAAAGVVCYVYALVEFDFDLDLAAVRRR